MLAAGIAIRLDRLSFVTLWSDEYWTIRTIRVAWPQLLAGQYPGDLNPPLYYILLRLWQAALGPSEFAWRMFSLIFGVLSIGLLYALARQVLGRRAGLAAMLIFAFQPLYIYYATEIRNYALMLFLALLAWFSYFRYMRRPRLLWLGLLTLSMCLSPYVHHFGVLVPGTVGFFWSLDALGAPPRTRWPVLLGVLLAVIAYLPGVWLVLRRQMTAVASVQPIGISSLTTLIWGLWAIPPALQWAGQAVVLAALLLGAGVLLRRPGLRSVRVGFAGAVILSAAAASVLMARGGLPFTPRYLLHLGAFTMLLMAAAVLARPGWWGRITNTIGGAAVVTYLVVGANMTLQRANYFPDWRRAATLIGQVARAGEPVVLLGWDATPIEYYLGHPTLTSFAFAAELDAQPQPSYLLVDSRFGAKPPQLATSELLFSDPGQGWQLLRFKARPAP